MFPTLLKTYFNFLDTFILSSANAFNLDQSTKVSFGKELKKRTLGNSVKKGAIAEMNNFTLTLSQTTNFRLIQSERDYRRQF